MGCIEMSGEILPIELETSEIPSREDAWFLGEMVQRGFVKK